MGNFLLAFEPVLFVFHFITAVMLILMILLQSGKGSDIGTAFGAAGSQSLFGARGAASLLSKITTGCAIFFLVTSLSLAAISKTTAAVGAEQSMVKKQLTEGATENKEGTQTRDYNDEGGIPVE
ncbi:MAG: preprotein translocase subunit SecG [Deltaproteobacteria bacterium]|nr:preprotein translocase subunit SecG [Deltaproteobacteria bacterium]